MRTRGICSQDCDRPTYAAQRCRRHYDLYRLENGQPVRRFIPNRRLSEDELAMKVDEAREAYPSLHWGTDQWYAALRADNALFHAVLDGIGDAASRRA